MNDWADLEYGVRAVDMLSTIRKTILKDNKWDRPQLEEKVQPDVVTLTFQLKEVDFDSLSPVCPKLEQVYGESAKMVLYSLCAEDLSISSLQ